MFPPSMLAWPWCSSYKVLLRWPYCWVSMGVALLSYTEGIPGPWLLQWYWRMLVGQLLLNPDVENKLHKVHSTSLKHYMFSVCRYLLKPEVTDKHFNTIMDLQCCLVENCNWYFSLQGFLSNLIYVCGLNCPKSSRLPKFIVVNCVPDSSL